MRRLLLSVLTSALGHAGGVGADAERRTQGAHRRGGRRRARRPPGPCRPSSSAAASPTATACRGRRGRWRGRSAAVASPRSPSTSEWCSLVYIATRPSRSPSMRCHSHSGRSVASRVLCSREHELEQLTDPARLGQRAVADVVLDVELVVLHPHPLAGGLDRPVRVLEEQRRDVGGVPRLLEQVADVVAAGALGLLVELEPPDVHRHAAVLGQQEAQSGRIERGRHPAILRAARGGGRLPRDLARSEAWSPGQGTGNGRVARPAVEPRAHLSAHLGREPRRPLAVEELADRPVRDRGGRRLVHRARRGRPPHPVLRADRGGVVPRDVLRPAPAPGRGGDRRRRRRGLPRRPDRGRHRLGRGGS